MNRGDHREDIFRQDEDRELFLQTLGEACAKTDWQIHAWCLMRGQFHIVVETPKANLVEGIKRLLGTCTSRFNRRHKLFGHLLIQGWREWEPGHRRKGDLAKPRIVLRLRRETTMTLSWIVRRLRMGTKTHLAHLLDWEARGNR